MEGDRARLAVFYPVKELKEFIECDIIGIIKKNLALGNITDEDAFKLMNYTLKLRDYICDHLGAEGLEEVRGMTDHSFMTEADIICEKLEYAEQKLDELQKDKAELQKDRDALQMKLKIYEERFGAL